MSDFQHAIPHRESKARFVFVKLRPIHTNYIVCWGSHLCFIEKNHGSNLTFLIIYNVFSLAPVTKNNAIFGILIESVPRFLIETRYPQDPSADVAKCIG